MVCYRNLSRAAPRHRIEEIFSWQRPLFLFLLLERRSLWRVLAFFLVAIVIAALGGLAWLYSVARSALPQLDGSVKVAGLSGKVSVIRDGHGVPTIDAAKPEDLFFAQGYVTAQDRLWQMDVMRRFAAGEISEILGADFIKHDREQRILGIQSGRAEGA